MVLFVLFFVFGSMMCLNKIGTLGGDFTKDESDGSFTEFMPLV